MWLETTWAISLECGYNWNLPGAEETNILPPCIQGRGYWMFRGSGVDLERSLKTQMSPSGTLISTTLISGLGTGWADLESTGHKADTGLELDREPQTESSNWRLLLVSCSVEPSHWSTVDSIAISHWLRTSSEASHWSFALWGSECTSRVSIAPFNILFVTRFSTKLSK